ncbi:TonB-dependent siderophore receptor [Brevundimonas intermedia]|uniref:TonB-dependent siderophore receptor n=1 Tax=Brevundimonas intermedia TaxID=74315 RepID=A0A4Y9RXV2_9CAUL|nr:TonB-dependent siderophore receptor [Brevundimonas intermedia]TFW12586.1 TonB-dependent siderophore receptor [Brevundimonas intermedia]
MIRFSRLACAVSSLALAAATPALAQQAQPNVAELGEIVVTGGSQVGLPGAYAGGQVAKGGRVGLFGALDTMDTPFNVTSYTETLIRDQQARSVGDVLQNDPAVRVTKGFGNFQEVYLIRGFPVYSDDMTYNGLYGVLPRQYVAPELLERVEVFHGATAFLNGAAPGGSGVGGAFNLVPKRATGADLNRLTAGWEGGDEIYAAADLARRFGADDAWGARLNLVSRAGEGAVEDQHSELRVLGLGVDRRGERARFSADLGWQDHRIDAPRPQVTPNGAVPEAPSADANFAQPWTYTDDEQLFGAARGEFDLTDRVTAWAAVGGRRGEEDNVLANPNANADGSLSAYRFDNVREDTVWAGDVGLRADVTTGPVGHRLVASASQVRSKSKNAYAFSNFAGFASDLYDPIDVTAPTPDFFVGGDLSDPLVTERVNNRSVAFADMMSLLDGRLLATVGVRYQEIETQSFDYNTGAEISAYDGDAWTPAFAVVFKPSERISLYANYAEALQPGATAPAQVGGAPVGNVGEVLAPFQSEQYEVGVKYDAGAFGGTLSVFQANRPQAYFDGQNYTADGEQQNTGVELGVYGEPVAGVRLIGGATWLDAEVTRSLDTTLVGKRPTGSPEFQANLNAEWDVPMLAGLTLEGRVVYTGEQPVSTDNMVELDAWTRFDAGVRYAFEAGGKPLTVRARVENLADEDQWVAVGGYAPTSGYLTLGAPRTFRLSVSAEF